MFRQNSSPRLYRHILDCSGLGLSVLTLPKQTSCQRDHQERPDLRSPASMTTAVDNVMLCESALCQRQWGGMGSSHTNVGPLGATPRPWLVRYPKESLCLLFTRLTGGKCKYEISHVFSCHGVGQCWPETVQDRRKKGYSQKVQSVCPVNAHRCSTMT